MMKKTYLPALAAVSALLLTGCADLAQPEENTQGGDTDLGSQEVQDKLAELYEKAKTSGEKSLVTYGPAEETYGDAYKVFMKRYPEITIENEYIFGAELATRLDQEFASGKHVGNIQNGGPTVTYLTYNADRCQAYEPFAISDDDIGAEQVSPDKEIRALSLFPFGIAYNKDRIKEEDVPDSLAALTEDKWKGQLLINDPLRVNGFTNSLAAMIASGKFDASWAQGIADNEPKITSNSALAAQSIATGESSIDVLAQYTQYKDLIDDGLPVGFKFPTEDAARAEYHYSCILKDNPAPAATELLYNWLYTKEGQDALASTGVYGVRPDSAPAEGLPPFADVKDKLLPQVPVEDAAKATTDVINQTKQIFQ